MCTYFKTKTDVTQNLIDKFFSNFDCKRTFPIGKILNEKKLRGTRLIYEKTEVFYVELNERADQQPVVILHQATFHNVFILCLWLRIKRRSDQGV